MVLLFQPQFSIGSSKLTDYAKCGEYFNIVNFKLLIPREVSIVREPSS